MSIRIKEIVVMTRDGLVVISRVPDDLIVN
jgi:hypothetical protein